MRPILLVIGLLVIPHSAYADILSDCIIKVEQCQKIVGKRLWVFIPPGNPNVVEVTFVRGDWTTSRTLKLKTGATFVVTALDEGAGGLPDFKIRLDDGRVGWADRSIFLVAYDPIAQARAARDDCLRRGQPKVGMTAQELIETCWRRPSRIVKKTTANGVEETYIYGAGHLAKLIDGKITEIIESR